MVDRHHSNCTSLLYCIDGAVDVRNGEIISFILKIPYSLSTSVMSLILCWQIRTPRIQYTKDLKRFQGGTSARHDNDENDAVKHHHDDDDCVNHHPLVGSWICGILCADHITTSYDQLSQVRQYCPINSSEKQHGCIRSPTD